MNQNRPLPGTDANGKEMGRKPYQEEQTRRSYQEGAFKPATEAPLARRAGDDLHPHPPLNTTKPPYSRRPSDPVHAPHRDAYTAQHNEALRMALGSILSPKRPFTPSSTSHPASGTASPAFFHALPFTGVHSSSSPHSASTTGAQTPSDSMNAPAQGQQAHGPNQQGHGPPHLAPHLLYPHWPGSYHHPHPPEPRQYHSDPHHPYHPHTPSRLGAGEEGPVERGHSDETGEFRQGGRGPIHDSSHPPSPGEPATPPAVDNLHAPAPVPVASASPHSALPSGGVHPAAAHAGDGSPSSGAGTPRAKFLDTLQGKSAWDALIHGSFS
ncbi:hypothetical protein EV715DRAFT_272120 [Schizophyllum commune]